MSWCYVTRRSRVVTPTRGEATQQCHPLPGVFVVGPE